MSVCGLERLDGEEGGRGLQEGRAICIPTADSCRCMQKQSQYCKVIIL